MSERTALVTGASRGIGRAIAFSLCRAGFDVVFAARGIEQSETIAAEIAACPGCEGRSMRVNLDVTSADSVKDAFGRVLKEKARVDVLVNNAGITRDGLSMRMKPADWEAVLDANLNGAFRCI